MLKVGLTGNIASGKSTVAAVWRDLGAVVVDADQLARRAVEPGTAGLRRIVEVWGEGVLNSDGSLDRGAMRRIVFGDAAARAHLERIVHPEVALLRDEAFEQAAGRGESLVVADVPLLFEAGLEKEFDLVVLVDAGEAVRERRLVEERGLDPLEARRMIEAQMPSAEKRPRADFVVTNEGTRSEVEARARQVYAEIVRRAAIQEPDGPRV